MTQRPGLVLGTAQLAMQYGISNRTGPPDHADAVELLRLAARSGVVAFDTAPAYGAAEEIIGSAATALPVFTKVGSAVDESIARSLRSLNVESIAILFFHDPDVVLEDREDTVGRAACWIGRGVQLLGASVYTPEQFTAALEDPRIDAIQAPLNVADGRFRELLDQATSQQTPVYARSVYLQGALLLHAEDLPAHLRGLERTINAVDEVADATGRSRVNILLSFVRQLPGVAGAIVGAETRQQLLDTLSCFERAGALSADAIQHISEASTSDPSVIDPRTWP